MLELDESLGTEGDGKGYVGSDSGKEAEESAGGVPINEVQVAPAVVSSSLLFIETGSNCCPLIVSVMEKSAYGSNWLGTEEGEMEGADEMFGACASLNGAS